MANQLTGIDKWINEHMTIFITDKIRQTLFENAIKQGITLFKGENLEILVVPIKWAPVRNGKSGLRCKNYIADTIAFFETPEGVQKRSSGSRKDSEMNMNGFDVLPGCQEI